MIRLAIVLIVLGAAVEVGLLELYLVIPILCTLFILHCVVGIIWNFLAEDARHSIADWNAVSLNECAVEEGGSLI